MHVRTIAGGLVATLLVAAAPMATSAQTVPSPFRFIETRQEAGIFAGAVSAARGRFGFGPGGGLTAGARWGIDLTGPLGFEATAGVISGTRDVVNPAKVVGDQRIGEADVRMGVVDARLRFTLTGDRTWHRLTPFVVAGGGLVFDASPTAALDAELEEDDRFQMTNSFFGTAGGGARLFLTERLALRGDAVFSLWKLKTPPGFSDPERGLTGVEEAEWVSALHWTLSAVIRF